MDAEREPLVTRLSRSRARRRRELIAIIAIFTVVLGGWLWRTLVYSRTPEYSLEQIEIAVADHDVDTLDKYVKLDMLALVAYDDLTGELFRYDASLTPETTARYHDFYLRIKPQLAKGVADTIRRFVATGSWTLPEGADLLKGRQLAIDFDRFLERSQLRNTEYLKVESLKSDGNAATAQVRVRDRYTDTQFTLEVALERQSDGHWCVVAVENYQQYLNEVTPRQNSDIAEYIEITAPVVDEYNDKFIAQRARFTAIVKQGNPLSENQIAKLKQLIEKETIPALKQRQEKLNSFDIRAGSQYLSGLRRRSTELTVAAWTHFLAGIENDDPAELNLAESLHKEAIDVDLRIEDVIDHNTVYQQMPEIP